MCNTLSKSSEGIVVFYPGSTTKNDSITAIFSQMGFYPVTPGSETYNIGSPIFQKATIDLGNGKAFTIRAQNVSEKNKYIQSAKLNGEEWNSPFFNHSAINNGGELFLKMGPKANKKWGVD